MGTRSLLRFVRKEDNARLCNLYRQYDGHPTGRGMELAEWLQDYTIVNGVSFSQDEKIANGLACLCAQWVAHEKVGIGGIYLMGINDEDVGEQYIYEVYEDQGIKIKCTDAYMKVLFNGNPSKYIQKFN